MRLSEAGLCAGSALVTCRRGEANSFGRRPDRRIGGLLKLPHMAIWLVSVVMVHCEAVGPLTIRQKKTLFTAGKEKPKGGQRSEAQKKEKKGFPDRRKKKNPGGRCKKSTSRPRADGSP